MSFQPDWFYDISTTLKIKLVALDAYASELRNFPRPRSKMAVEFLAAWRGANVGTSGGSFDASLAIAYYLGFSHVYLIGFDAWTIQPARNMHWYERGEGIFFEPTNFATEFLETLKKKMDIYTISVDGSSCNVRNRPYLEHTGQPPMFRENRQIIDKEFLRVLATYPGYKI